MPDEKQLTFLHRIDNVLFCHGGLTDKFVPQYVPAKYYNNVDAVIGTINGFGAGELWQYASPLWYRPQYYGGKMYKPRKLLQVVESHTRGNNHEEGELDILRCFLHLSGREADRNVGIPGVGYR